jgi:threonine synthase
MAELATIEGIFVCPEGATLVPAVKRLLERGDIDTRENVVLLNTGKGLKYTDLISTATASSL